MEPPLHILLSIHHHLDAHTGAPGATIDLGVGLREAGQKVDYVSFDDLPGSPPPLLTALAFPWRAAARMSGARRHGIDVVDASTGDAWVWSRTSRGKRRPLLVTRSHGLEQLRHLRNVDHAERSGEGLSWRYPLYTGGWRLREIEISLRASDLILVLNEEEREHLVEQMGIASERVQLTANGVRDAFLERAKAASDGPGGPRIAVIGAYRVMKGVEHGSEALAAAMARDPRLQVSFLGTGVGRDRVLAAFEESLHDRVAVVERYQRDELPKLLEGHSIGFFPTLAEGFSLALVEAMACGLAPVASAIPGNRRMVEDDVNGLLVAPGDASAAGAALSTLLGDEALLARLRRAARGTAEGYSWTQIARQTVALYRRAIETKAQENG